MIDNILFLYINTTLAVGCFAFGIVFLTLPLPKQDGLKRYKISLKTLSIAYFVLAISEFSAYITDASLVNVVSIIFLTVCFLQSLLFTTSILNLLHPELISKKFIAIHSLPVVISNLVYWLLAIRFGNPVLSSFDMLMDNWQYPMVLLRIIIFFAVLIQFVYFVHLFRQEASRYDKKLNDCFADNYKLHLPRVKIYFYSSVTIGVYALFTSIVTSPDLILLFFMICAVFYVLFGAFYIQYPRTYSKIEKAFRTTPAMPEVKLAAGGKLSWETLKQRVIEDKYYTMEGVNIEDMAQYLKIGRTTLSGFINRDEGMNFNAWIRLLRVNEAIRILTDNDSLSIAQVSEMVGYSEPSNFSRQFKIVTGITPSEWCQTKRDFVS